MLVPRVVRHIGVNIRDLNHPDENHRKRAVQALAHHKDPRSAALLARVLQNDPSESVRALAREALEQHRRTRDPLKLDDALAQLDAAEYALTMGALNDADAALRRALSLDPTLPTGTHAEQVAQLQDALRVRRANALSGWRTRPKTSRVRALVMLSAIVGLAVMMLFPSLLRQFQKLISGVGNVEVRQISGVQYYLARPDVPPPPGGYPLLVALPGLETTSTDLVNVFAPLANDADVLLVVPEYTLTQDSIDPLVQVDAVLGDVRAAYAVDSRGVVLFGLDVGGDVATRYARDYFGVVGVVAAASDDPALPPEGDTAILYLMLYPTDDALAFTILPRLDAMRAQGNEVRYRLVDFAPRQLARELAIYAVDFTVELWGGG